MSITIYSSKTCIQCQLTKKSYDQDGVDYESVSIDGNEVLLERLRSQGHLTLPVVVTPTDTWAGFQPDRIRSSIDEYKAVGTPATTLTGPDLM